MKDGTAAARGTYPHDLQGTARPVNAGVLPFPLSPFPPCDPGRVGGGDFDVPLTAIANLIGVFRVC